MSRISNYAANAQIMRYMFETQNRMNRYQAQVSSEKISQNYAGISRDSQFLVNMENARDTIREFMTNNETTDFRLQIMQTSTSGIDDVINEFMKTLKNRPLSQSSSEAEVTALQQWAFDSLSSLQGHLNTAADGRYIYSGSRVTTRAVNFNLTTLKDFQAKYDGSAVTYATTRSMHLSDYSFTKDTNNQLGMLVNADNWLTFRRDDDGFSQTGGDGSIESTSGMFSNAVVGSTITVTDSVSNNGTYTIKSISADGSKVVVNSKMLTDERFLSQLAASETIPTGITTEALVAATLTKQDGTLYEPAAGLVTGGLAFNVAGTITAANGGTLAGIAINDVVKITGSASNDGTYVVASNDGTVITVTSNATTIDLNDGTQLNNSDFGNLVFDQAAGTITAATAAAFSAIGSNDILNISNSFKNDGLVTIASVSPDGTTLTVKSTTDVDLTYDNGASSLTGLGNLTFDRAAKTLTSTTADFSELVAGDVLIVANTGENNGRWVVSGVSTDGKTLTFDTVMLTDEGLSSGTKFFDYSSSSKAVFDSAANTINIKDSANADLPGIFTDLQNGDSLVVAGSSVSPAIHTKVVFTDNGADLDTIQVVADDGTTPVKGVFSDISVGDTIDVTGSAANDGVGYVVNWISKDGSTVRVDGDLAGIGTSTDANSIALTGATFTNLTTQNHLAFSDLGGGTDRITMQDDLNAAIPNAFDNMSVGMTLTIAGATSGANNGTFQITAVNAAGGFIDVEAYPAGGDPGLAAELSNVNTTITASGNDGTYTVESVSTDGSTVTLSGTTQLIADQTDADGTQFTASGYDFTSGTKIYMDATADTIEVVRKDTGATITNAFDNLRVGQTLTTSSMQTAANNAVFTIGSSAAGVITTNEDITVTEGDPKATLSVYAVGGTVAANSYYDGDNVTTTHRMDNSRSFDMDVNALDPAFEKAIRAMGIIAQGQFATDGGLDQNLDRVADAIYLLHSAISANVGGTPPYGDELTSNLNDMGTDISFKRVLIQETTVFHQEYVAFADDRIAGRENVDMLEAVTHMLDESNALEAAYETISRIQGLSLTHYL